MDDANIEKAVIMGLDTSAQDHWAFKGEGMANDASAGFVKQLADRSGNFWGWQLIAGFALICTSGFTYVFGLTKRMELM